MKRKTVTVVSSPFQWDYEDDNPPPWSYSVENFKGWVYEVLLDLGKAGQYPRNLNEAIDIAESFRYGIEVTRNRTTSLTRSRKTTRRRISFISSSSKKSGKRSKST